MIRIPKGSTMHLSLNVQICLHEIGNAWLHVYMHVHWLHAFFSSSHLKFVWHAYRRLFNYISQRMPYKV